MSLVAMVLLCVWVFFFVSGEFWRERAAGGEFACDENIQKIKIVVNGINFGFYIIMAESEDIWEQVRELLSAAPPAREESPAVVDYSKAIPMVSLDADSFGESPPTIKLGHSSASL